MAKLVTTRVIHKAGPAVLLDVSGSMGFADPPDPARRIDRLAQVLAFVLTKVRPQALVAFSDVPELVEIGTSVRLPEPCGGTALHLALDYVAGMAPRPTRCVVLSDGVPNDVGWALAAARTLRPMAIDAYYCGGEGDEAALQFMRQLSEAGGPGGRWDRWDLRQAQLVGEALTARLRISAS